MATKQLAMQLGLIRQRSRSVNDVSVEGLKTKTKQLFSYLIVIDFESTCWKERNAYGQEIIEFPAVLLNTSTGKIESEFHTYVQPQEHPVLSAFCSELTGITQAQVEAGVPLPICLSQFSRWLLTLEVERKITLIKDKIAERAGNLCTFVTWSDWDLGVCLQYECKRKQIPKPQVLNKWIDLRATYRLYYNRKPKGLSGALKDLGIEFSGREHSGLDDARNTAHLAWRMMTDGCIMKVTKSLDRAPVETKSLFHRVVKKIGFARCDEKADHKRKENESKAITDENQSLVVSKSLVSPKTLLGELSGPVGSSISAKKAFEVNMPHGICVSAPSYLNTSIVLVTTTVDCISESDASEAEPDSDIIVPECEDAPLLTETDESTSYDDILLEEPTKVEVATSFSLANTNDRHPTKIVFKRPDTTVYSVRKTTMSLSHSQAFKKPWGICKPHLLNTCSSSLSNSKETSGPRVSARSLGVNKTTSRTFTVYTDDSCASASSRPLSFNGSMSSHLAPSFVNMTCLPNTRPTKGEKWGITPPLCDCGRRAKRMTVGNGGPNHGRVFYSCPVGKMGSGKKRNCGFFKWESAVFKMSSSSLHVKPNVNISFAQRSLRH